MSKLLTQGGFGCVYYPGIQCDGTPNLSKKVITKLQKKGISAENEIIIGKMITKINNFQLFFSPIIKSCSVNLANIDKHLLNTCEIINKNKEQQYIILDVPYIDGNSIIELIAQLSKKGLMITIFETYQFLLGSIELLLENKIVHFDLKRDNILYEKTTNHPILIDFGISLPIDKINRKNIGNYLYVYAPDYYLWPIDVHIICFLLHKTDTKLTKNDAIAIASEYTDNNKVLGIFSDRFKHDYKQFCIEVIEQYVDKDRNEVIDKLMTTYSSWDNYAISILYLNLFFFLFSNGYHKNELFIFFSQILLINISPDFTKRMTIEETRNKFSDIFYSNDNTWTYFDFVEAFDYNETTVTNKIKAELKSLNNILLHQTKKR